MARKLVKFCIICILVGAILVKILHEPKLVSCITTMDHAYLTILVNPLEFVDMEKLEEKIVRMCKEDEFDNMKLQTEERAFVKQWDIMVYSSKCNMQKATNGFSIEFEQ